MIPDVLVLLMMFSNKVRNNNRYRYGCLLSLSYKLIRKVMYMYSSKNFYGQFSVPKHVRFPRDVFVTRLSARGPFLGPWLLQSAALLTDGDRDNYGLGNMTDWGNYMVIIALDIVCRVEELTEVNQSFSRMVRVLYSSKLAGSEDFWS